MITLGQAEINTDGSVTLVRGAGWLGTYHAVRITNYTGGVLVLNGVDSSNAGTTEYLLPLQQNVYRTSIKGAAPILQDISLGSILNVNGVLVEWSDSPKEDFPGTYPTTISAGGSSASQGSISLLPLVDHTQVYTIAYNAFRTRLQLYNYSGAKIFWSSVASPWNNAPWIADGGNRTLISTSAVFLKPSIDNLYIEVIEEAVTPVTFP